MILRHSSCLYLYRPDALPATQPTASITVGKVPREQQTPIVTPAFTHASATASMGTHTHNHFTALWILSGTTRMSQYQKKHLPAHTHRGHQSFLICFIHLLRTMASSVFNPRALESFSTISLQVFFSLLLGLAPSTSYSIHFFTQSLSSFRNTCPYHRNQQHG